MPALVLSLGLRFHAPLSAIKCIDSFMKGVLELGPARLFVLVLTYYLGEVKIFAVETRSDVLKMSAREGTLLEKSGGDVLTLP